MDLVTLYKKALDHTGGIVAGVTKDQFDRSTPCSEFDVRALLQHTIGGQAMFTALAGGEKIDLPSTPPDMVGDDHVGAYQTTAERAAQAWSDPAVLGRTIHFPFGEMPGMRAIGVLLLETALHGWDLAKATGQNTEIPADIAAALKIGMQMAPIPPQFRGDGMPFQNEITVPDDASDTDKIAAYFGRKP